MTALANGRHDRFRELAASALDFALPRREAAELEAHLATCPACARLATGLRVDAVALRRPAELLPSYRLDAAIGAAIAGRPARPSASRALVLVAATALLLAAILGAAAVGAYLLRTLKPPLVVNPSPSIPAVVVDPSAVPSGEPGPTVPSLTWQLGSIPPMFEDGQSLPAAVAGGDPGLVALGGRVFKNNQTPSGATAGAWHSTDGLTWEPVTGLEGLALGNVIPVDDEPMPGVADAAWGPAGFVAVGIDIGSSDRVGATWHSGDGITWNRTELPAAERARPAAVAWTGSGYVAVGTVREDDAPRAAAWRSADGATWRRVPDGDAFDIGGYVTYLSALGSGGLADVAALADGSLVAVGHACAATVTIEEQSACHPIVIRSTDGESWSLVPGPDPTGVGVASVAAGGEGFVAAVGGPGSMRFVQAHGPVGGDESPAQVAVSNAAGWGLVELSGIPRLERIVAFGDWSLAVSSADNRIRIWASPDGERWTEVPGVPQPPFDAGWDPGQQAFSDVALAVVGSRVVVVGANNADPGGHAAFSIVGTVPVSPGASPTPGPSASPLRSFSPPATPGAGALPVTAGHVQLAPGPARGAYVLVSSPQSYGDAPGAGRSILALLDPGGQPRAGWPVALEGWTCEPPDGNPAWPPSPLADGSVAIICHSDATMPDESWTTRAFRFDATGRQTATWQLGAEIWGHQPRVVGDTFHVVAGESIDAEPYSGAYWLETVATDGAAETGARYEVAADATDGVVVLGPDGTAYRTAGREITAFDQDGVRAGWPVQVEGVPSALAFGPDGRVYLTVTQGVAAPGEGIEPPPGQPVTTRLLAFDRDGRAAAVQSEALPFAGATAWSGAGPDGRPLAPLVAADGTTYVIGEADRRAIVYRFDASGKVMSGWPYRAAAGLAWQGSCPVASTGCGEWRSVPAVNAGSVVCLPLAATSATKGGSLVAVGPAGKVVSGWPVTLTRPGADFWSVVVADDGTAHALAVEPETRGGTSATILAIASDSTVLSRTTVVEP